MVQGASALLHSCCCCVHHELAWSFWAKRACWPGLACRDEVHALFPASQELLDKEAAEAAKNLGKKRRRPVSAALRCAACISERASERASLRARWPVPYHTLAMGTHAVMLTVACRVSSIRGWVVCRLMRHTQHVLGPKPPRSHKTQARVRVCA